MKHASDTAHDRLVDRHARRVVQLADAKIVTDGSGEGDRRNDPGWIEGYAAVWDVVDAERESFARGAFKRSLRLAVPAGRVKLMVRHFAHGGDVPELIGTVSEAREDERGLWFRAALSSIRRAQDVRVLVNEGHVKGLSVGFKPVRWSRVGTGVDEVLVHRESELVEVTVTLRPVNAAAAITASKAEATSAAEKAGTREPNANPTAGDGAQESEAANDPENTEAVAENAAATGAGPSTSCNSNRDHSKSTLGTATGTTRCTGVKEIGGNENPPATSQAPPADDRRNRVLLSNRAYLELLRLV